MAQLININSTEFRRCNLSAIQSGGTWDSIAPDENEIILISTTNSLTAGGSGECDAYIKGDGTTAATALPLQRINGALEEQLTQLNYQVNGTPPLEVEQDPTYTPCKYVLGNGVMAAQSTATLYAYCNPISIADVQSIKVRGVLNNSATGGIFFANNAAIPTTTFQANARLVRAYYGTTSSAGNVNDEMTFSKAQLDELRNLGATHIYVGVYQAGTKEMVFGYEGGTGLVDEIETLEINVGNIEEELEELPEIKESANKNEAILTHNVGIPFDVKGYYDNNGNFVTTNPVFRCTRKIDLTGVTKITAIYTYGVTSAPNVCYFDASGTFLSSATWNAKLRKELTTSDFPSGAKFVTFATGTMFLGEASIVINDEYSLTNRVQQLISWANRTCVCYGDSITAQGNDGVSGYIGILNREISFLNIYGRGVGGQYYVWNNLGWYTEVGTKGAYLDRYNYDSNGNKLSSVVSVNATQGEIANIENALGKEIEIHRGCFCSWDRITTMIPSSIKNSIELIILMGGTNDFGGNHVIDDGIPEWSASNTTDTDWVSASEYNGGDYDLSTFTGGMMSTIMKMTIWCPNALIVVVAPWGNYNTTTKKQSENGNGDTIMDFAIKEKELAAYLGCPFIDISAEAGVNPFNASSYFADQYHPNAKGASLIARVLVGGLRRIPARFDPQI